MVCFDELDRLCCGISCRADEGVVGRNELRLEDAVLLDSLVTLIVDGLVAGSSLLQFVFQLDVLLFCLILLND